MSDPADTSRRIVSQGGPGGAELVIDGVKHLYSGEYTLEIGKDLTKVKGHTYCGKETDYWEYGVSSEDCLVCKMAMAMENHK